MQSDISAPGNDFPSTYRMDGRTRRMVNTLLLVLACSVLFINVMDVARLRHLSGHLGNLVFVDVAFGGLLAFLGSGYNKRVILHQDAIEVAGWFYSRKLNFAEIRGRQTTANSRLPYGYAYVFMPTDNSKRKLALPPFLHMDQFFRDWIKTISKVVR